MLKRILLLLLPVSLAYGSGFSIYEHGAKSTALGGAFIARADDASAVFYNPAGISQLSGTQYYFGSTLIVPKASFQGGPSLDPFAYNETKKQWFPPSTFYVTFPVYKKFTAGLGIYSLFGLGTDWGEDWIGRNLATKSNLMTFYLNPVLSYQPFRFISLAAGFNVVYGSVTLERSVYYAARDMYGLSSLDANTYGYGFNLGLRLTPFRSLSLGIVYRSNINLNFNEGDATFRFPNIAAAPELVVLFPPTTVKSEIELPDLIGAGISYTFFNRLTTEVNYVQMGWSSYDELVLEFEDPVGGQSGRSSIRNYEDTYSLRFGLEYQLFSSLALRGGYIIDNKAVPDKYVEPSLPEGDRNIYSVGLGYQFQFEKFLDVTIDAAYVFLDQKDRTITDSINGFNGTYKSLANMYALSVGWTF